MSGVSPIKTTSLCSSLMKRRSRNIGYILDFTVYWDQTGTTIIIPFISEEKLLSDAKAPIRIQGVTPVPIHGWKALMNMSRLLYSVGMPLD